VSQAKGGKKGSQSGMCRSNREGFAAAQLARLERKESIARVNEIRRRVKELLDNIETGK
jgi:hypothetical protein